MRLTTSSVLPRGRRKAADPFTTEIDDTAVVFHGAGGRTMYQRTGHRANRYNPKLIYYRVIECHERHKSCAVIRMRESEWDRLVEQAQGPGATIVKVRGRINLRKMKRVR